MFITSEITENKIAQGDLVFIYHKTKPTKTGWWRKIREGTTNNRKIYYILEKPMHKDFNAKDHEYSSHVEQGLCIMTDKTLKEGLIIDKYEIFADVRGVHNILLTKNNYSLNDKMFNQTPIGKVIYDDNENVIITNRFKELINLYQPKKVHSSDIENLANNLR